MKENCRQMFSRSCCRGFRQDRPIIIHRDNLWLQGCLWQGVPLDHLKGRPKGHHNGYQLLQANENQCFCINQRCLKSMMSLNLWKRKYSRTCNLTLLFKKSQMNNMKKPMKITSIWKERQTKFLKKSVSMC